MEAKATPPDKDYGVSPNVLAHLCDWAPDAVCLAERYGEGNEYIFRYFNRAFEHLYDARREELLGTSVAPFMQERASPEDFRRTLDALERREPFRVRRGMKRPDGAFFWIEVNFQPIPWDGGAGWMFISRDVTREKQQHDRMVQLTAALENGYEPVSISTAAEGKWQFSYVNDAFTRATGYLLEELIGESWNMLVVDPGDLVRIENVRAMLFSGQQVRTELNFRRKDGTPGVFEVQIQPIREGSTGDYASIVSIYRDVTDARRREQRLVYEAEHDPLTGLYNRRYLAGALETAISMTRSSPAHALLFADLDGFKAVNDTLGHEVGDRVLVAAARAFETAVFETDALARWGGDEFAVLLYHCSLSNAERTAAAMTQAFHAVPERHGTTVSVGAVAIQPGEKVATLIRRADQLCYAAKAAGRNRVLAEPERKRRV